jgi:hypothetical protein
MEYIAVDMPLLKWLVTMKDREQRYSSCSKVYSMKLFSKAIHSKAIAKKQRSRSGKMSIATTDPFALVHMRNRIGTNRSILHCERHVPAGFTIFSDPFRRASPALLSLKRKKRREKQRKRFRVQLAMFKTDLETIIFDAVVTWALQYAPKEKQFGLITDFSRKAFKRLHKFQYELQPEHIEELKEMVWSLQLWAMGEGIHVETLKYNERSSVAFMESWPPGAAIEFDFSKIKVKGDAGVVGMFAAMVMYDTGLQAGDHNYTHATMAWKEVMLASMARSVEAMAIGSMAWQCRILALVVDRWILRSKQEDRDIQWDYINRFLLEDVSE